MTTSILKQCRACGKAIKGRSDKKYCGDYCRNYFNNQHRTTMSGFGRTVLKAIQRNRQILESICATSTKVSADQLLDLGFKFKYHTHQAEYKRKGLFTFCFEYGYKTVEQDVFQIIKLDTV